MIIFRALRWQNLLSTGNLFTEIQLNRSKSTLIVGKNGDGKSTMIEALTFVLYGKPFRSITKPDLVNSIIGKNLLVEIEFSIGSSDYLVRRGMKPSVFEIFQDGALVNQTADPKEYQAFLETSILKMNFKSFSQIVVLGSANYVPFMSLDAAQRRTIVEDLLDIQIFSIMNSLLKESITENKNAVRDLEFEISVCEQKIELHKKHIQGLVDDNEEMIADKAAKIEEQNAAVAEHTKLVAELIEETTKLNELVADHAKINSRTTKLFEIENQFKDRIKKLRKEIQFYHDHDNCPTCKQGIEHDFKSEIVDARNQKIVEVETAMEKLDGEIQASQDRLAEIRAINAEIQSKNESISKNNHQLAYYYRRIKDLNAEIAQLKQRGVKIDADVLNSAENQKELDTLLDRKRVLMSERSMYDVAAILLKDTGIKTKIIKQYIPVMNKIINKYLGDMDFFVNFELDESFKETIKSRHRDKFSYSSFSEGEKARIDLALMFAWRDIAKLRNSAATNLLILDEVFDGSLDTNGSGELLGILSNMDSQSNVFVISHKSDQLVDKFHSMIKFEKRANFSMIAPPEA